jgi:hypothetical protein
MNAKLLAGNVLAIGLFVASCCTAATTTVSTTDLIGLQGEQTAKIELHEKHESLGLEPSTLRGGSHIDSEASFERELRDLEAAFERDLQNCSPRNGPCVYDSACCGRMQCIIPSGDTSGACRPRRVGAGISNVNCRLRNEVCQVDRDCCGGLDCNNKRCSGEFTGLQRCGERFDSCVVDLDCCAGLSCPGFECITDPFRCSEVMELCVVDDDCCSGLDCDGRVCRTRTSNGRDCVLAGEFCRSDSECCSDSIDSLVCSSRVCRPFSTGTNACVGRGRFCIDDADCCGGFSDGGLFCGSDNTCQREASSGCSRTAGTRCLSNDDCCGGNLQCAPNGRCTRIYTGPGYP